MKNSKLVILTALVLALVMVAPLAAMAEVADSVTAMNTFMAGNSRATQSLTLDGKTNYVYLWESGVAQTTCYLIVYEDYLTLQMAYKPTALATEDTYFKYETTVTINSDGTASVAQKNQTYTAGSDTQVVTGTAAIDPATFTAETAEIEIDETLAPAALDETNTLLECFADYLTANETGLTLADFGFTAYEVKADRVSGVRTGAEPAIAE